MMDVRSQSSPLGPEPEDVVTSRERNKSLPIHQLPSDVLSDILLISVSYNMLSYDNWVRQNYYQRIAALSGVCTWWFTVINDSPRLWTIIDIWHPRSTIKAALAKSRTAPLDIICPRFSRDKEKVALLEEAGQHMERWRSALIWIDTVEELALLASSPTPFLESLELQCRYPSLLRLDAPRLQNLILRHVSLDWTSPSLAALRVLHLSHDDGPNAPSIPHLLSTLRLSPRLTSLRLQAIVFSQDETSRSAGAVDLPLLRYASIGDVNLEDVQTLLSTIHAPRCEAFTLALNPWNGLPSLSFSHAIVAFVTPSFDNAVNATEAVRNVRTAPSSMEIKCGDKLILQFGGVAVDDLLDLLAMHFEDLLMTVSITLTFGGGDHAKFIANDFTILERLTSVEHLRLADSPFDGVLPFLSRPRPSADGVWTWPCPNLKQVEFIWTSKANRVNPHPGILLDFARREENIPGDGSPIVLPRALDFLGIATEDGAGMDEDTFQTIVQYLGDDRTRWTNDSWLLQAVDFSDFVFS